jgi:Flp pilus assembly protein TadG
MWTLAPRRAANARLPLARMRRGQASLEILLVLFILIPLVFGGIELSRAVSVRAALDSGVGVAARALSLDNSSGQWIWAAVMVDTTVQQNVFGSTGVEVVNVYATTITGSTPIDITNLGFSDPFCIVGETHFTPDIPFLTNQRILIRVRHCGIIEEIN